jgi:TPR repeat protein
MSDDGDMGEVLEAAEWDDLYAGAARDYFADRGDGMENDPEQAVWWLTEAAEHGDVESQYQLGMWRCLLGRHDTAVDWFEQAARSGHGFACVMLGHIYQWGYGGVVRDRERARRNYERAIELGAGMARPFLAFMDGD